MIAQTLKLTFSALMVPMINTAEEAANVVKYAKFPPYGLRGQGSAFPAIGHGLTTPEYMKSANETILTIVQIETKEGVANVDEIAAVPGIGTFSSSLEYRSAHADDQTIYSLAPMTSPSLSSATPQRVEMSPNLSMRWKRLSRQLAGTASGSAG